MAVHELRFPVTDPGEILKLRAGDVMVQRGTNHAWFNRGSVTARLAFVLIDAQPLAIGDRTE